MSLLDIIKQFYRDQTRQL